MRVTRWKEGCVDGSEGMGGGGREAVNTSLARALRRPRGVSPGSGATSRTSLPKFSPLKSFSRVSGNVSSPATTSSFDFMRPSCRYCAISATATPYRSA